MANEPVMILTPFTEKHGEIDRVGVLYKGMGGQDNARKRPKPIKSPSCCCLKIFQNFPKKALLDGATLEVWVQKELRTWEQLEGHRKYLKNLKNYRGQKTAVKGIKPRCLLGVCLANKNQKIEREINLWHLVCITGTKIYFQIRQ